jgi:hypothetical protein
MEAFYGAMAISFSALVRPSSSPVHIFAPSNYFYCLFLPILVRPAIDAPFSLSYTFSHATNSPPSPNPNPQFQCPQSISYFIQIPHIGTNFSRIFPLLHFCQFHLCLPILFFSSKLNKLNCLRNCSSLL